MPKRCGDKAEFNFKVKNPMVGQTSTVMVKRKDGHLTASHSEVLQQAQKTKVVWPDLDDGNGKHFGARQADHCGLEKKAYHAKFGDQTFDLELHIGGDKKKGSQGLRINDYPDVGKQHQQVGIPMATEMWEEQPIINAAGATIGQQRVQTWSDPTGTYWQQTPGMNCGNFHIELKDGVVVITVKLSLTSKSKIFIKGRVFKKIKKACEEFWGRSAMGFAQWSWHRNDCKRKKDCNCALVMNGKGQYVQHGCCKVPMQVVIEEGADNPVEVHMLSLKQRFQVLVKGYATGTRADTGNFWYPENNPHTFAHEIGHMMGYPDQYWYGVVAAGSLDAAGQPIQGASWPIDDQSIMGQNMTTGQKLHFDTSWFNSWVQSNVDAMSALP